MSDKHTILAIMSYAAQVTSHRSGGAGDFIDTADAMFDYFDRRTALAEAERPLKRYAPPFIATG